MVTLEIKSGSTANIEDSHFARSHIAYQYSRLDFLSHSLELDFLLAVPI